MLNDAYWWLMMLNDGDTPSYELVDKPFADGDMYHKVVILIRT